MNFSEALAAINDKQTVSRRKWNGKARVYLVHNKLNNITHIEVRTVNSCLMYAASSEDLLAIDWELFDRTVNSKSKVSEEEIKL